MASEEANGGSSDLTKIPVWLTLQRCRGVGWLHAGHGGCLGLGDSGLGAAVFSSVVLVPAEGDPPVAGAVVGNGRSNRSTTDSVHKTFSVGRNAYADAALRVLDSVAPVEVEATPGEAAEEGGYGEAGDLFAALLSPSVPTEREAKEAKTIQGDFLVMHHVLDKPSRDEEDMEEVHLCFGELLWHPMPPRLFACRSLWSAPQPMRLTKSTGKSQHQAAAKGTTVSEAAGSNPVLVLTDVEEDDAGEHQHDNISLTAAAGFPLAALRNLQGTFGNTEVFRRVAAETWSLALSSVRETPATIARLSHATAAVLQKASADWAALGSAAITAAATAGGRAQKLWKDFSGNATGNNNNNDSEGSKDNPS